MASKAKIARWSFTKHQWLALIGGISLLIWGISGLAHVTMTLFGPQQAVFTPPVRPLDLQGARPIPEMLADAGITRAIAIRTVAGREGSLIQVTTDPLTPRRYFDPESGRELMGEDARHAEYLARHYLKETRPVVAIDLQTGFDADYPWVNRLLPVWRIRFAGEDRLTAYVHTETGSLAAVNNRAKAGLQTLFRALHTWEWVPASMEWLRVIVVALMVGSLAALAITGIFMLVAIRRGRRLPGSRGLHRAMGYVLALPLIMFSLSGIYHLVLSALAPPGSQMRMARPIDLGGNRFPIEAQWRDLTRGLDVTSLSLVEGQGGRPLYRLGLAKPGGAMPRGEHDHGAHGHDAMPRTASEIRNARFDGIQPNGPALYIDAATGQPAPQGDRELARLIAGRFSGASDEQIARMELVTRFGPDYDFRNKRLPVWRIDYGAPLNETLFIDTLTGTLADRVADWQKPERAVFSFIHKWNFLFPFGRMTLNALVGGTVVALILFMAGIGLTLDARRRASARKQR